MKVIEVMTNLARPDPLVSVIIPCYNSELYLLQAIRSVMNQTYTSWQLVVVDDGSTDATTSIISELSRELGEKMVTVRTPNLGACSARNSGVAAATGVFIAFLDSDDYWHKDKLKVQIDYLETHSHFVGVGCQYSVIRNEDEKTLRLIDFKWTREGTTDWLLLYGNPPALNSVLLIKRSVFNELGGFDTNLGSHAEDMDFLWRLNASHDLGYLPCDCATIRQWSGQGHRHISAMYESLQIVYEKLRISEPQLYSHAVINLDLHKGINELRLGHFFTFVSITYRPVLTHPVKTVRFVFRNILK